MVTKNLKILYFCLALLSIILSSTTQALESNGVIQQENTMCHMKWRKVVGSMMALSLVGGVEAIEGSSLLNGRLERLQELDNVANDPQPCGLGVHHKYLDNEIEVKTEGGRFYGEWGLYYNVPSQVKSISPEVLAEQAAPQSQDH